MSGSSHGKFWAGFLELTSLSADGTIKARMPRMLPAGDNEWFHGYFMDKSRKR